MSAYEKEDFAFVGAHAMGDIAGCVGVRECPIGRMDDRGRYERRWIEIHVFDKCTCLYVVHFERGRSHGENLLYGKCAPINHPR